MTIQIFANNAKTTLGSAVNSSQTTITVAAGKGALFPNPSSGQIFKVTMVSASDATVYEVCNCTSRTGDVLTVVRAQEGTTAKPFLLNDIVGNYDTAGTMQSMVQLEDLQANTGLFAVASGTANALSISLASGLTSIPDGMTLWVKAASANTGAATLQVTLGSTIIPAAPIVKGNNAALLASDIPSAGYPLTLVYSSTYAAWVLSNPYVVVNLTAVYPVGSIYMNASNGANPSSLLGFGTWVSLGASRMLIGFDASNPLFSTVGNTGGSANAVVVSHTHTASLTGTAAFGGAHTHTYKTYGLGNNGLTGNANTNSDWGYAQTGNPPNTAEGSHSHSVSTSGTTDSSGASGTNANLPPYLTVYMWQRTA